MSDVAAILVILTVVPHNLVTRLHEPAVSADRILRSPDLLLNLIGPGSSGE